MNSHTYANVRAVSHEGVLTVVAPQEASMGFEAAKSRQFRR